MGKVQTINFQSFVRNDWKLDNTKLIKFVKIGSGVFIALAPKTAFAATADATFGNVLSASMNIVDWLVVGVFMFAGVSWMFGHRSKALELIIGGAAGYILARHAIDIRNFLKSI